MVVSEKHVEFRLKGILVVKRFDIQSIRKKPLVKRLYSLLPLAALAFLAFSILVPVAPHNQLAPSTDSSVFLYVGDHILEGAVPYRDVWDHKGPLIYYIDALGLALGQGSRWGVWLLELAAVSAAAFIAYRLLKSVFGSWTAMFGAILFLIELRLVLDLGNLTEEYALPLQFLLLWSFWRASNSKQAAYFVLIGLVSALCFLLRPNMIGIPLAIGLVLVTQIRKGDRRVNWNRIVFVAVGGLLVLGLATIYFLIARALPELWDAMFRFNFAYNAQGQGYRLDAFVSGFRNLPLSTMFGIAGWVLAVTALRSKLNLSPQITNLVWVVVIGLPIEMALTSLTGNNFPHYYMSWLPLLVLSSSFLIYFLPFNFAHSTKTQLAPRRLTRLVALPLILAIAVIPVMDLLTPVKETFVQAWEAGGSPHIDFKGHRYESVLNYIYTNIPAEQKMLVWGNQVTLNWLTNHDAPTRFVYQTPVFEAAYTNAELRDELLEALRANPGVIIDSAASSHFIPPLSTRLEDLPREYWPLFLYFQKNYSYAGTFKPVDWDLYLYHGEGVPLETQ